MAMLDECTGLPLCHLRGWKSFIPATALCRRQLSRVSKRWRRIVFAEPSLWRELSVRTDQQWQQSAQPQLALLQRHAPHVVSFTWRQYYMPVQPWLPAFLAALRPSQLTQLTLSVEDLPQAALSTVQQLRLTSLRLCSVLQAAAVLSHHPGLTSLALVDVPQTAATLQQAPTGLRSLHVDAEDMSDEAVQCLLRLTGLTELSLAAEFWVPLQPLQQLTQLSQLRTLQLWNTGGLRRVLAPEPSRVPHLERFDFQISVEASLVCAVLHCCIWSHWFVTVLAMCSALVN